jgi:NAD(P) transhydrogenase subunit alpha
VALVPETASRLIKTGLEVIVEAGAGEEAGYTDDAFREAGAAVAGAAAEVWGADVIVKVQAPTVEEAQGARSGSVVVTLLPPGRSPDEVRTLASQGVTTFSMDLIPRITRAQPMDALSSQSNIAGYKAVLLGAAVLPKLFPMLMTAAGTIAPARVFVIGAGVAGLQAIATARRLGAIVTAFDVRPAVKEQVESLGAKFLAIELAEGGEGEGGYAKELSEEAHRLEQELLREAVAGADVVITTALVPGRPAPKLITEAMVQGMHPASVIVDLAAPAGGNCELTVPGQEVVRHGVTIVGEVNLPATVATHSSQMYARNLASFLGTMVRDGELAIDLNDEILSAACVTHGGEVKGAAWKV